MINSGKISITDESPLKWVMNFVDLWSGIFDNLCFLNRIKLRPYKTKWELKWVDWFGSAFALTFVLLSIVEKLIAVYKEAIQIKRKGKIIPGEGSPKKNSRGGSSKNPRVLGLAMKNGEVRCWTAIGDTNQAEAVFRCNDFAS